MYAHLLFLALALCHALESHSSTLFNFQPLGTIGWSMFLILLLRRARERESAPEDSRLYINPRARLSAIDPP